MIYRASVYTRTIKTDSCAFYWTYMHIDGIGAYIFYKDKSELIVENLRRYLCARQRDIIYIKANNPLHFLERFAEDYPESRVGGPCREEKTIWFEEDKPILELPDCPYLFETENGFKCGDPENFSFPHTGCYLDSGSDPYKDLCVPYMAYQELYNIFNGRFDSLNRYEILLNERIKKNYREDIIQGHIFLRKNLDAIHLSLWPFERKKEAYKSNYIP